MATQKTFLIICSLGLSQLPLQTGMAPHVPVLATEIGDVFWEIVGKAENFLNK